MFLGETFFIYYTIVLKFVCPNVSHLPYYQMPNSMIYKKMFKIRNI